MSTILKIKESIDYNKASNLKELLQEVLLEELMTYNQNNKNKLLIISAKHRSKSMISMLLEKGLDINYQNAQGETLLFSLIKHNPTKINQDFKLFLLDKGANVNIEDNEGKTALFFLAANARNIEELENLAQHSKFEFNWNKTDKKNNTILHIVLNEHKNSPEMIDYLSFKGVNFHEVNNLDNNALDVAMMKNSPQIIHKLIHQYKLKIKEKSLHDALNVGKEDNFLEALNAQKVESQNSLNLSPKLIDVCLSFNHIKALKALSQTAIWTEENVLNSLQTYRNQFFEIFEIDDSVKNEALEFAKVSLVYFEKEKLEKSLNQAFPSDTPRIKV